MRLFYSYSLLINPAPTKMGVFGFKLRSSCPLYCYSEALIDKVGSYDKTSLDLKTQNLLDFEMDSFKSLTGGFGAFALLRQAR